MIYLSDKNLQERREAFVKRDDVLGAILDQYLLYTEDAGPAHNDRINRTNLGRLGRALKLINGIKTL